MKTFRVYAREEVYYLKDVEAESMDELRTMIGHGDIYFSGSEIVDGSNFQIDGIEEV
jgi:hypothetical protein